MASGSKKVIYAALFGNAGIAVTKFIAAALTGSSAMISEAIHSVVDTGNQVLLLWGVKRASKPPDARFPFGHGKEIYFWSFVVAILIFAVGAGVSIYEGIKHLMHPPSETHDPTVNYIVLAIALAFEGFAWFMAWKQFRTDKGSLGYFQAVSRGKDPTMFVVLFEDSAAMLGLIVAGVGIALTQVTGNVLYDGLASVIIGLILAGVAIWLAYETKGLLIGESASEDIERQLKALVGEHEHVQNVNELVTLHMGPEFILVTMSLDFGDDLDAAVVKETIAQLNSQVKNAVPNIKRVFIEAESWADHQTQTRQEQENAPKEDGGGQTTDEHG